MHFAIQRFKTESCHALYSSVARLYTDTVLCQQAIDAKTSSYNIRIRQSHFSASMMETC